MEPRAPAGGTARLHAPLTRWFTAIPGVNLLSGAVTTVARGTASALYLCCYYSGRRSGVVGHVRQRAGEQHECRGGERESMIQGGRPLGGGEGMATELDWIIRERPAMCQ